MRRGDRWHLTRSPRRRSALLSAVCVTLSAFAIMVPMSGGASAATTLIVDKNAANCSDSGSGTSAQPFCTIVKAATVALAGDTVEVRAGTYAGTVDITHSGTAALPIVLRPAAGASVTVTSSTGQGFKIASRNWITIMGFVVSNTKGPGFGVSGTGIVIRDNDVSAAGTRVSGSIAKGISLSACTNCLVVDNRVHDNSDHGIFLSGGTTGTTILRNEVFGNARGYARAASGISASNATTNTYEGNIAHDNEDSGIQVRTGANDFLIVNNVSYRNGDHGFDTLAATGARYISNTAFGNLNDGISIESTSTGATVWNNIAVDNGLTTNESDLWVSANSQPGFSSNYNIFWNSTSQKPIRWGSVRYASVSAFHTATGNEANGISADPRFVAAASGDLHLAAGSPAIDSADSSVSGMRSTDAEDRARVDDAGTANTGAGVPPFADRGAFEFVGSSPPPNRPPDAVDDSKTVPQDSTDNAIAVLLNDSDPDADPLSVTAVSDPPHGTAAFSSGGVTYTPDPGYGGPDDLFTYTISDGRGGTDTAAVIVTVTPTLVYEPPVANDDDATVQRDSSVVIPVLGNDTHSNGTTLQISSVGSPSNGVAVIDDNATPDTGDDRIRYTPTVGFTGTDTFTYSISDGLNEDSGTVSITVTPPVSNLITNPGFETDTAGWKGSGTGITLTRRADGHTGGWSAELKNTTAAATTCTLSDSPDWVPTTSAGTYTFKLWVKGDVAGATLALRIREYASGTNVGSAKTTITLSETWREATVSYTARSPGQSRLDLEAYVSSSPPGTCFLADDASLTNN